MIEAREINGKTYYTTTARGVEYVTHETVAGWFVGTHRLALGRGNGGGGRYYPSLTEVAAKVRAFRGLDVLVADER